MQIVDASDDLICCCSCTHNIRKCDGIDIECYCDIDNHYIGYVANFESVCEEWKEEEDERNSDQSSR